MTRQSDSVTDAYWDSREGESSIAFLLAFKEKTSPDFRSTERGSNEILVRH